MRRNIEYFKEKQISLDRSKNLDFKIVKMRIRELRGKAIPSEILVWEELRNRKLSGNKFLEYSRNWIMCTPLFAKQRGDGGELSFINT